MFKPPRLYVGASFWLLNCKKYDCFSVAVSHCGHLGELGPPRTGWTTSSRHHWSTARLRLAEECTAFALKSQCKSPRARIKWSLHTRVTHLLTTSERYIDFLTVAWVHICRADYRVAWRSYILVHRWWGASAEWRIWLQYFHATIPPCRRPKADPPSVVSWSPTAACPSTSIRFLLPWIHPNLRSDRKSSITDQTERENGRSCVSTIL